MSAPTREPCFDLYFSESSSPRSSLHSMLTISKIFHWLVSISKTTGESRATISLFVMLQGVTARAAHRNVRYSDENSMAVFFTILSDPFASFPSSSMMY